jgi:hypothetical protein
MVNKQPSSVLAKIDMEGNKKKAQAIQGFEKRQRNKAARA